MQVHCDSSWTGIRRGKTVSVKSRKIVREDGWRGMLLVEKSQNWKSATQSRLNQKEDGSSAEEHMIRWFLVYLIFMDQKYTGQVTTIHLPILRKLWRPCDLDVKSFQMFHTENRTTLHHLLETPSAG